MKFGGAFQVSREAKDDGSKTIEEPIVKKPKLITEPAAKRPKLKEQKSRTTLRGTEKSEKSTVVEEQSNTLKRNALREFFHRTGANLRATGAKLQKSKVIKPASKRNSLDQIRRPRSFDVDSQALEGLVGAGKQYRLPTDAFLERQKTRASSRKSSGQISNRLTSPSQAELDQKQLTADQVQSMFVGAPCFSVEEDNGRYLPHVIFRGSNVETSAKFSTDYQGFGHFSFAASTLNQQNPREAAEMLSPSNEEDDEADKAITDLMEVPNMVSLNGLDPGAVGFDHFLQLQISDNATQTDDTDLSVKRRLLHINPELLGLRPVDIEISVPRLIELGRLYTASKNKAEFESPDDNDDDDDDEEQRIEAMGGELFKTILSGGTGDVTVEAQISALQKVLNIPGLWRDFGMAEWRLKVGHLLWASYESDKEQDDEEYQPKERDVLLLQLTLAAELLVRLRFLGNSSLRRPDLEILESQRGPKVNWDLVLAQRFLENVNLSSARSAEEEMKPTMSSIFSSLTYYSGMESSEETDQAAKPIMSPKNAEQQRAGLVYFAETIRWPHADSLAKDLAIRFNSSQEDRPVSTVASVYLTPSSSPRIPSSTFGQTTSFTGANGTKKSGLTRATTAQSVTLQRFEPSDPKKDSPDVSGWLSRSWLTGLVLPGEIASHFLISALLENSPQAMTALGDEANLYGGFVYEGRTFWSKSCVVGRVLASRKNAAECMGWISVPTIEELEDGWKSVSVKDMSDPQTKPRIKDTEAIAKDSDLLHNQGFLKARAGDFTKPVDPPVTMSSEVIYRGLSFLESPATSDTAALEDIDSADPPTACLTFGSMVDGELALVKLSLQYDVYFVSSYPCHPKVERPRAVEKFKTLSRAPTLSVEDWDRRRSQDAKSLERPRTAPSNASGRRFQTPSPTNTTMSTGDTELALPPAHPLHNAYQFDIVPAATLFGAGDEILPRTPPAVNGSDGETKTVDNDVIVVDCRGGEDLELFARAWCAKVGEHALIGKSGRTCLSCCVREARALGICVVIRT